jgi:hypothetical protein
LQQYAACINAEFKSSGLTKQQILSGATRFRRELEQNPSNYHPENFKVEEFSMERIKEFDDRVSNFLAGGRNVLKQIEGTDFSLRNHPWHGVENTHLQVFDVEQVEQLAKDWQRSISQLTQALKTYVAENGLNVETSAYRRTDVQLIVDEIEAIPTYGDARLIAQLPGVIDGNLSLIEQYPNSKTQFWKHQQSPKR